MGPDDGELIRNDLQSEKAFESLRQLIAGELFARIAVRDPLKTKEDAQSVSNLIADAVLDRFQVRERPTGDARYRWSEE